MKVNSNNLEVKLNTTNNNSSKVYLLEDTIYTKPIKKDEIKLKKSVSLIPANSVNLTTNNINDRKNETVIDVALEIKENFDDVPIDKKIYLANGVLAVVPGGNYARITTDYMMVGERKKKIDKSLQEKNPKETLAQTIFIAKNTWAVVNNSAKLVNYIAQESYTLGKISKTRLNNIKGTSNNISNINNALLLPFTIADFAYAYDSMNSYKKKIEQSNNKSAMNEKEMKVLKDTYNMKKITFGLSAISLGALGSSIVFKSANAANIVLVSTIAQNFSKFLEDENARESVKDVYNLLKAKI